MRNRCQLICRESLVTRDQLLQGRIWTQVGLSIQPCRRSQRDETLPGTPHHRGGYRSPQKISPPSIRAITFLIGHLPSPPCGRALSTPFKRAWQELDSERTVGINRSVSCINLHGKFALPSCPQPRVSAERTGEESAASWPARAALIIQ